MCQVCRPEFRITPPALIAKLSASTGATIVLIKLLAAAEAAALAAAEDAAVAAAEAAAVKAVVFRTVVATIRDRATVAAEMLAMDAAAVDAVEDAAVVAEVADCGKPPRWAYCSCRSSSAPSCCSITRS